VRCRFSMKARTDERTSSSPRVVLTPWARSQPLRPGAHRMRRRENRTTLLRRLATSLPTQQREHRDHAGPRHRPHEHRLVRGRRRLASITMIAPTVYLTAMATRTMTPLLVMLRGPRKATQESSSRSPRGRASSSGCFCTSDIAQRHSIVQARNHPATKRCPNWLPTFLATTRARRISMT
jgi:hypothetical protein